MFKKLAFPFSVFSLVLLASFLLNACGKNKTGDTKDVSITQVSDKTSTELPSDFPWKPEQMLQPADLVKVLEDAKATQPYLYSIGPSGLIKGATDIGPGQDDENLDKLRKTVEKLPKDAPIVVYCGCCPYKDCPNVRPVHKVLSDMQFTNFKLLDLPKNLKTDWINHNYPLAK